MAKRQELERAVIEKVKDLIEAEPGGQMKVLGTQIGLWKFREIRDLCPKVRVLHPDIDILLSRRVSGTEGPVIIGVEVKAVRFSSETLNLKFYQGLDEAIAILRFGVDRVRFYQVFLAPVTAEEKALKMAEKLVHYGIVVREIVTTLQLPIGYTPVLDFLVNDELCSEPPQVLGQLISPSTGNPFLNTPLQYPTVIRNFLLSKFLR